MALRSRLLTGALTTALALPGCARGPRLTVAWTGADSGSAMLAAHAVRCRREVRIMATSGDTGVALVVYFRPKGLLDSVLPVLGPAEARGSRPSAAVGARWIDSTRVDGFRSVKGTVRIHLKETRATGSFTALTRREGDLAEVTLTGRFAGLPIGDCDDSAGSGAAARPGPEEMGVPDTARP